VRRFVASVVVGLAAVAFTARGDAQSGAPSGVPNLKDSLKFVAIGDNGTGDKPQYDLAEKMNAWHRQFPFELVIMLGDNIYGRQRPQDFIDKFENPYKPLLEAGVKFFMLDSDYMDPKQLQWLDHELKTSRDDWKIAYFHHPLYSSGGRHGSEVDLRVTLEPLFVKYGVNAVYSGHDHVYERLKPQKGIYYFVSGSGGQLRPGDLRKSPLTEVGYDAEQTFMLNEIAGDELFFQVISRTGRTVDAGVLPRQPKPKPAETPR